MGSEKMGQFISELRKSHNMTQKELAEKLDISDKAVSKWERGQSYPDILMLSPLSEALGVTATELLNGERSGPEAVNVEVSVVNALEYVGKTAKNKIKLAQNILIATFSILTLLGIFVVSIIDVATSGTFSWSLIPICACVFVWLVSFPVLKLGLKGIPGTLIVLSLTIVPFLYVLDLAVNRLAETEPAPIFSMGSGIAIASAIFLWIVFLLVKKLRTRKLVTLAVLALLASPLTLLISFLIARTLEQPWLDVWTVFNVSTPIMVAAILFIIDFVVKKREN